MAKRLTQSLDEFEQTETPEESYTPEQLEKGQRILVRIRQAGILAAERIPQIRPSSHAIRAEHQSLNYAHVLW